MINLIVVILSLISTSALYVFNVLSFSSFASYFLPIAIFSGFFIGWEIIYIAYLYITSLFINPHKEYKEVSKYHKFTLDSTLKWVLSWGRAKVIISSKEKFPKENCLIVSNHRSNFDPICIGANFTSPHICFISKFSNLNIPIAGNYIHRNLYMGIDRENPKNAVKTINKAVSLMLEKGYSIGVYPEGTRNKENKGLLDFKPGCFKIALKSHKPIVVFTCVNALSVHKNAPFRRTIINLDLIKVIEYEEYKDMQASEISNYVRALMEENLAKYDEK